jgi:hypothetical protein
MRLGPGDDICEYINKFEDLCRRSGYAEQEWHDTLREGLLHELQYFLMFREPDLSLQSNQSPVDQDERPGAGTKKAV